MCLSASLSVVDGGAPPTVLLVDDDNDTVELLAMVLERAGYRVLHAANGQEALLLLTQEIPALILLDIEMPVMTGQQFREQQRRDSELVRIPTIVMTGSREEPVLDVAVRAVLHKPFTVAKLFATINAVSA
ncbi:N/A [soil metagenome]